jgi:hypothetical protein
VPGSNFSDTGVGAVVRLADDVIYRGLSFLIGRLQKGGILLHTISWSAHYKPVRPEDDYQEHE